VSLPFNQILQGDCRQVMRAFPADSIDLVMFSPPYFGLRAYGVEAEAVWGGDPNCQHDFSVQAPPRRPRSVDDVKDPNSKQATVRGSAFNISGGYFCSKCNAWRGELGLEPTWRMYVEHMVEVCREVKRVLKKTGSMYIVLGDTYQDKNLLGIPWRVAFALIEDGWILRNDIIWYKPNHMPSSVKDRLTQTYEHIFHFVKSRKYYYNLDNIREPHKTESIERWDRALRQKVDSNAKLRRKMLETTGVTVASMVPKWFEYTKHDLAVGRVGGFSYTDPLHKKAYNVKGKNPGNSLEVKWSNPESPIVEHFRRKGSGGHYDYGGLSSPEGKHYAEKGRNPGDTIKVKRGKYKEAGIHSPGERDWYWSEQRNLPPKEEIYRYLVYWKEKSGLSLDDIKRSFHDDGDKVSHWFTRPDSEHGFAYPSKEDWVKLKELLGFDDKYDKAMTETFLVPVTDLGHPLGKNPGDYWSISTKPFKGLHFAVYPVSICVRPILSSAPPDGVVLDPMCGSGTTCLAAQLINLKRWDLLGYEPNETAKSIDWRLKWIGIDINRSYVELARDRLKPYLVKTMLDYG